MLGEDTVYSGTYDVYLNYVSLVLLLLSPDFMATGYCNSPEWQLIIERQSTQEMRIVPIRLRPVDIRGAPFAHLKMLPDNVNAVTDKIWRTQDGAFYKIAIALRQIIEANTSPEDTASPIPFSLPVITSAKQVAWNVRYSPNPYFIGRDELIARLHETYHAHNMRSRAIALCGIGGIGKTQIAIEYAYRYKSEYGAVLWTDASSWQALSLSYVYLADILGLAARHCQERPAVIQAVRRWLAESKGWLLILDNLDEIKLLSSFLPENYRGHVLITTQSSVLGTFAQSCPVTLLEQNVGARLLLQRAHLLDPYQVPAEDFGALEEAASKIVKAVSGLPLAIDQAAAYIEETGCSLQNYLDFYQKNPDVLIAKRGMLATDHLEAVTKTFLLAFGKVKQISSTAAQLLYISAFLYSDSIPEQIFTVGGIELGLPELTNNSLALNEVLRSLRSYSLVQRDGERETFSVHPMLQIVLRSVLSADEEKLLIEQVIKALNKVFPDPRDINNWPVCKNYTLHVQSCLKYCGDLILHELAFLYNKSGYYLSTQAQYDTANAFLQKSLTILERLHGDRHADVASMLNTLGDFYANQDKYEQAEKLLRRALAIFEDLYGPIHPEVAYSLNHLAVLYRYQGKYKQAERLLQRALDINKQVFGSKHTLVVRSLNNLGKLYMDQGKRKLAEKFLRQALAFGEQLAEPGRADVARVLNNLAGMAADQGKYKQAEEFYWRSIALNEQVFGFDHPAVTTGLNNLAWLYVEQNIYEQAENLFKRSLFIREKALGEDHPEVVFCLVNLASCYRNQGKYAEAEPLYRRALDIVEQLDTDVVVVLENYAELLRQTGREDEARVLESRALTIRLREL
ncbi:FxSxx-COOH system tetratricopeptide repeat protein [Ktedonosporobacter rubrisoli]|nr:FxSxx-COOH system tetratricopeptide repeat protein [Ktedonosporobacter rubrisoli]